MHALPRRRGRRSAAVLSVLAVVLGRPLTAAEPWPLMAERLSGIAAVFDGEHRLWAPLRQGHVVAWGQAIRTGPDSALQLASGARRVLLDADTHVVLRHTGGGTVLDVLAGQALASAPDGMYPFYVRHGEHKVQVGSRQVMATIGANRAAQTVTRLPLGAPAPQMALAAYRLADRPSRPGTLGCWLGARPDDRETPSARLVEHHVRVWIYGDLARVQVTETFHNGGREPAAGSLLYPLPPGASLCRLASVDTTDKASEADWPASVRDGLMKATPPPIAAGGEQRVLLEYAQPLDVHFDRLRFQLPLAGDPNSSRPLRAVSVTLDVRADSPIQTVETPSHPEAKATRLNATHVQTALAAQDRVPMRDVVLTFRLPEGKAQADTYGQGDAPGFFRVVAQPRFEALRVQGIGQWRAVVVDTSASSAAALPTLCCAARLLISGMRSRDRVKLFASDVESRALVEGYMGPSASALRRALDRLDMAVPAGASDVAGALRRAADDLAGQTEAAAKTLVYMGDGRPTAGTLAPDQLADEVGTRLRQEGIRLVVVLAHPAVAPRWLRDLVERTGGTLLAVDSGPAGREALARWAWNPDWPPLTGARPVVTGVRTRAVMPAEQPVLFPGEPIAVCGRFTQPGPLVLTLTGRRAGEPVRLDWKLKLRAPTGARPDVGRQWAAMTLDSLLVADATPAARKGLDSLADRWRVSRPGQPLRWSSSASPLWPTADVVAAKPVAIRPWPSREAPAAVAANVAPQRDLLDQYSEQEAIRVGRLQAHVRDVIARARRLMRTDPAEALEMLRLALEGVEASDLAGRSDVDGLRRRLKINVREAIRANEKAELNKLDHQRRRAAQAEEDRAGLVREGKQARVAETLEKVKALANEGRYAEAAAEAGRARQMDAGSEKAAEAEHVTRKLQKIDRARSFERYNREAADEHVRGAWEAVTPPAGSSPLVYPDAQRWAELTRDRAKYKVMDLAPRSAKELEIQSALAKPVTFDFTDSTLSDVADFLRDFTNVNIVLDRVALAEEGLSEDAAVNLKLSGVSLKSALRLVLAQLNLTYLVQDEVLLVTSQARAASQMVTRVYPVADLIIEIGEMSDTGEGGRLGGGFGGGGFGSAGRGGGGFSSALRSGGGGGGGLRSVGSSEQASRAGRGDGGDSDRIDDLAGLIKAVITPQTWDVADGGAAVSWPGGEALVAGAPWAVHEALRSALRLTRAAGGIASAVPYATVRREMLGHLAADADMAPRLALHLARRGEPSAVAVMEAAVRAHGGRPNDYLRLAQLYRLYKRPSHDRRRALSSFLEVGPKSDMAYHTLGWQLELDGQHAKALEAYRTAAALEPKRSDHYEALARVASRLDDRDTLTWATVEGLALGGPSAARLRADFEAYRSRRGDASPGADLVVRIRWDTDADVDLVVEEPNGPVVSFMAMASRSGAWLSFDDVDGHGPETFKLRRAAEGRYRVWVGLNRAAGDGRPTTVTADVWQWKDSLRQTFRTFQVQLHRAGQRCDVTDVTFPQARDAS